MANDKRQRQKEARQARLEAERSAAARARTKRTIRNAVLFAVAIVLLAVVLSQLG